MPKSELVWPRRHGKDDISLHWTASEAFIRVGNYIHMLPMANQARRAIWEAVNRETGQRRIDEAFPPAIRDDFRESDMFIRFKNGSTWQVGGSDNYMALLGSAPIGVVLSEYAYGDPDAWGEQWGSEQVISGGIAAYGQDSVSFLGLTMDIRGSGFYRLIYNKRNSLSYRGIGNSIQFNAFLSCLTQ